MRRSELQSKALLTPKLDLWHVIVVLLVLAAVGLHTRAASAALPFSSALAVLDPFSGDALAVDDGGSITAPMTLGDVTVRASISAGSEVVTARIEGFDTNAAACNNQRITTNDFPAEFRVPAAWQAITCDYRVHYWRNNWQWQGQDRLKIVWSESGEVAVLTASSGGSSSSGTMGGMDSSDGAMEGHDHSNHAPDSGFGDTEMGRYAVSNGSQGGTDYSLGEIKTRSAHGNRVYCPVSHLSYDDPIVYPDQPGAAHLHMFWGNSGVDAFTKGAGIRSFEGSSCEGGNNNQSSSWIPALFNAEGEVVLPESIFVYYKTFGVPNDRYDLLQVMPEGLEMLASKSTLNFTQWVKLGPSWKSVDGVATELRLDVPFPSCVATVDGTLTGEPILRYQDMPGEAGKVLNSHVAYPGGRGRNEVGCPPTHPYRFPGVSFIVKYDAAKTGTAPYLSSDAMMGAEGLSTLHGDYIAGLDPEIAALMLQCVQEARSCGFDGNRGQLPERFYAPNGMKVYRNSVRLEDEVDRTPWGATLSPMKGAMEHHAH